MKKQSLAPLLPNFVTDLTPSASRPVVDMGTFYVPPRKRHTERGILFYSSRPTEGKKVVIPEIYSNDEMKDIPVSYYSSPLVDKYLRTGFLPSKWSAKQAGLCDQLWRTDLPQQGASWDMWKLHSP